MVINAQTFLDYNFGSIVKLSRLIFSDYIRPQTFEAGYRASVKTNVSE